MEAVYLKGLNLKGLPQCVAKLFQEEVVFIVEPLDAYAYMGFFSCEGSLMEKPGGNGPSNGRLPA